MSIRNAGRASVVIGFLALTSAFHADDKSGSAKPAPAVVINIEGPSSKAKYIKEGDDEQKPVVVRVGQTVRWVNKSNVTHTATQGEPDTEKHLFDTGTIKKGKSAQVVFDQKLFESAGGKPGGEVKLDYYCRPHPDMKSTILLRSAEPPPGEKK